LIPVDKKTWFAPIIAQSGFGPSPVARIRYNALASGLHMIKRWARENQARVRMPRIGTGAAGGTWSRTVAMIERCLSGVGIDIYDLR
ncbi:MAG: hypothetical protein WCC84_13450, partial [Candidatus Cybelea sp.]